MCNRYRHTGGPQAIREMAQAVLDLTGNLQPVEVFPDRMAPIVRVTGAGQRELTMARWGMPGPPQFGGAYYQHPQYFVAALAPLARRRQPVCCPVDRIL